MCGFVGFCDSAEKDGAFKEKILNEMTGKIIHRGPDDIGSFSDEVISLGFARLKILDMLHGTQPMLSEDGRYVLCFNGEIYNYIELRDELSEKFGIKFRTESDTEVLLYTCIKHGERALEMLRGMFSFIFYDRENHSFFMARDPFGIKPLYYGTFDNVFMFSSEIKAFLSHPKFEKSFNSDILPYYLQFQYVPTEETAFTGVKRLLPGHLLKYKDGVISTERYFYPPLFSKSSYLGFAFFSDRDGIERKWLPYKKNLKKTVEKLRAVTEKAVERHTRCDVEYGAFLSGGVDSGYITALAKPKKVFTVGFKNTGFDERAFAAQTADKFNASLTCIEADAEDFFNSIEDVQYHSDEPYANLSAVPLYLISKKAKESVEVVLSGEGADELFGGYDWYLDSKIGKLYRTLPEGMRKKLSKNKANSRTGEFLRRNAGDAQSDYIGQAKILSSKDAADLLLPIYREEKSPLKLTSAHYAAVNKASLLRKKMYLDSQLWLPYDILNKADKMSMASSLELRVPYLDLSVLSIAQGCADKLLIRRKTGKYVLRVAAIDKLGAAAFRPKKGFPVPFRSWIREKKYADIIKSTFESDVCKKFFDSEKLLSMLSEHVSGSANHARAIYTVYAFCVWYERFFVKEPVKTLTFTHFNSYKSTHNREKLLFDTKNTVSEKANNDTEVGNDRLHTDNSGI